MNTEIKNNISTVLASMPKDWVRLTTHRLDIYNEKKAKTNFVEEFNQLVSDNFLSEKELAKKLSELPTAFDYIRLGHPLSCILEWAIAKNQKINVDAVITFSSQIMPILAVLRANHFNNKHSRIVFKTNKPSNFDAKTIQDVYGYDFSVMPFDSTLFDTQFDGSTILISNLTEVWTNERELRVDFNIYLDSNLGSVTLVSGGESESYIKEIQHVRRRESIAMTPQDCLHVLKTIIEKPIEENSKTDTSILLKTINEITNTKLKASIGSSGLSVQYAIMMGLIHSANENHKGKDIKFIVPPNCYGGTNDQARRVAACIENVEIVDLPVDSGQDMVSSVERILDEVAAIDAIAYIIAEIPTNPRVEVPDLVSLRETLLKKRKTKNNEDAIAPVFILDQTFCPNIKFLGPNDYLSGVRTISYVSGSKFPSGGLCTAGYCVANDEAEDLISYIDLHLKVCDNEATDFQLSTLTNQMPSMIERIDVAYRGTRSFVDHISDVLPEAKINFVSRDLANSGFTPSVFSLDLPTKGSNHQEREDYKRQLNLKLINLMIKEIPLQSKYCVSYGQLKGCYWTIPATSTQGTTKEGDKDYIVRVSISPDFDLEKHKEVFTHFCKEHIQG